MRTIRVKYAQPLGLSGHQSSLSMTPGRVEMEDEMEITID